MVHTMMWTTDLLEDKPQQAVAIKFTIYNAECKLIKGKLSGWKTFCKKTNGSLVT